MAKTLDESETSANGQEAGQNDAPGGDLHDMSSPRQAQQRPAAADENHHGNRAQAEKSHDQPAAEWVSRADRKGQERVYEPTR